MDIKIGVNMSLTAGGAMLGLPSLLVALAMSFSSHAAPVDGGYSSMAQIQAEFVAQQDWMIQSLWSDFGVQAQVNSYSPRALGQLRELHNALRNNQPINVEKFDQIRIACKKAEC